MMCEECGKNPASVKLVSVVGGEKHEKLLCLECMKKVQKQFKELDLSGLAELLDSLMNQSSGQKEAAPARDAPLPTDSSENDDLICFGCGTTYQEYKKTGYLGCPMCYDAFRRPLTRALGKTHVCARHLGKVPGTDMGSVSIRLDIDRLRHRLSRAITEQEYEQAADIRDRIKELRARLDAATVGEGVSDE